MTHMGLTRKSSQNETLLASTRKLLAHPSLARRAGKEMNDTRADSVSRLLQANIVFELPNAVGALGRLHDPDFGIFGHVLASLVCEQRVPFEPERDEAYMMFMGHDS